MMDKLQDLIGVLLILGLLLLLKRVIDSLFLRQPPRKPGSSSAQRAGAASVNNSTRACFEPWRKLQISGAVLR